MQRFNKHLIWAIIIVVVPFSIIMAIILYIEYKNNNEIKPEIIDEKIENERENIKKDSIIIDSIVNSKEELKNEYIEKIDSVSCLSDDSSVIFFREYIRNYERRFHKNINQ